MKLIRYGIFWCGLIGLLFALPVHAADPAPRIRAHLDQPAGGVIYTGERATLVIELFAPGYFSSAPTFDLPDPDGMLLMPPDEGPQLRTETIEGVTYTVQRHELAVFSAHAGQQQIPPINVRFSYKTNMLDQTDIPAVLRTDAVPLSITAPPGTENLGYVISARRLTATETWHPELASSGTTSAKTGNAFTRTITYSAAGVPGMIFPPFPSSEVAGLGIYPKPPEILDTDDRGTLTGKRRDEITYICEQPGTIVIPGATLTWWDIESKQLQTIEFPSRTFEVASQSSVPGSATQPAVSPKSFLNNVTLYVISGVVGLAVLAWIFRHALRGMFAPLYPVHLVPLNPNALENKDSKTGR